ncbi:hypothetical protein HPB52_000325 [Rhipicephalus sanguineus]|uniref:C2H2-type domain-containing protein n=1 Tax=Rhipicephalus sanguineus TaxID=34632 RepID=A0A9D4T308_RHISA|nr:hypothetical protein HPB52_000325 [Rhipicephalus sanguineus]
MDKIQPLFGGQVRLSLAESVGNKVAVLDADCDPDALERRRSGALICACPREFDSVREFESHYASRHRLTCAQCRAAMPTERLLELHIAESHDPIFAARPKYECVVEGCPEHFASWADRKMHAIDAHSGPLQSFLTEGCNADSLDCNIRSRIDRSEWLECGHGVFFSDRLGSLAFVD